MAPNEYKIMADKKGPLLKKLISKRNEIRAADEVVKKYKEEYDTLAQQMIEIMQAEETTSTGSDVASASLRFTKVAQVTDWEKFYRYISRNKAFFLLQKRVSDLAYRELLEDRKGRDIPGTEPFVKIGLNLRVSK